MRALVVNQFGGPGALELQDLETPPVGPRDVLVDVTACGVCYHDVLSRKGLMRGMDLPRVLGHEIAGVAAEVGSEVRDVNPGDRVATTQRSYVCGVCELCRSGRETLCDRRQFLGHESDGGYAEQVVVAADCLAVVPDSISDAHAAVAACTVGTELNALREVGKLGIGETVLVTGAGGGLGTAAIQLAHAGGARVVAATRSQDKADRLRELGAHDVVVAPDGAFSTKVREVTHGRGVDLVIDNIGGVVFHEVRKSLATGGRWVMVGELSGERVTVNLAQLFLRGLSLHSAVSTSRAQLVDALELLALRTVGAVVTEEVPLADAPQAHAAVEAGTVAGRIVLQIRA